MSNPPETLTDAFIAKQRARLLKLQSQLTGSEDQTLADERNAQSEHGDEAHEFEDGAQRMEEDIASQALRDVNAPRIDDIQRALEKIDDGTYGYSDESGDPIPVARLEVRPEAVLTVAEQERREERAARSQ